MNPLTPGSFEATAVMRDSKEHKIFIKDEGYNFESDSELSALFSVNTYYRLIKSVKLAYKTNDSSGKPSGIVVDKVVIEQRHDMFVLNLCPNEQPLHMMNNVWYEFSNRC